MSGGDVMVTLKNAFSGVGDVLAAGLAGDAERFTEALKGLSPTGPAVDARRGAESTSDR